METHEEAPSSDHNPQLVGNAFVHQYYTILHQSPEHVHRFYQDSSVLSQPRSDGVMTSVTTLEVINESFLSFGYNNYKVEILTVDSQVSYKNGVIVLVTGVLTGKDNLKRKFTQSFFLAPQDKGYFVLNDVLRYVDAKEPVEVAVNDVDESAPTAPLTPDPEATHVPNHTVVNHTTTPLEEDTNNDKEVSNPMDNGKVSVDEKEIKADHPLVSSQNNAVPATETASSKIQDNTPKKSYASIVQALKGNTAPFQVRFSPSKSADQSRPTAAPPSAAPEASAPSNNNALERNIDHSVKGHSVFVANLPMNATVEQLEGIFKKFGSIKHNGIQVRSYKQKGNCFGFVEFESASSVRSAVEASPILIGNRKADVEEKRANNDNRGKFPPGRGGYRNGNFRGRGNFNGGRNFGRNEFEKQGEFSGQVRGTTGRNGEANQKVYRNVEVRFSRPDQGRMK